MTKARHVRDLDEASEALADGCDFALCEVTQWQEGVFGWYILAKPESSERIARLAVCRSVNPPELQKIYASDSQPPNCYLVERLNLPEVVNQLSSVFPDLYFENLGQILGQL